MQLPAVDYDSLLKLFHTDVYGFPLFSLLMFATAGAFVGGWYWRRGTKVETKIVASNKATHVQTAEEYASQDIAEDEELESPPRLNGGSDLEDRLISALAQAPWRVKEGSEIALAKNESNKWGIATNKITFVLGGNEEAVQIQPPEPTPPNPEVTEETE